MQVGEKYANGRVIKGDRVFWDELPFLGKDLLEVLTMTFVDMSAAQRTNLAAQIIARFCQVDRMNV